MFKVSVVGVVKLHLGLRCLALLLPWAIYSTEPTHAIRPIPCVVEWIRVPCGTNERYAGVPWTSNMQECRVDIGGPFPTFCKTRAFDTRPLANFLIVYASSPDIVALD